MLLDTLTILLAASAIPLATAGPTRVRRDYQTFSLAKRLPEGFANMSMTERVIARRELEHARHAKRAPTANIVLTAKQSGSLWTMTPLVSSAQTPVEVQVDTGSSDFWSNAYTPTAGAAQFSPTFSITYADGDSANGACWTDRAQAGGLIATKQTICKADGSAAKAGVNTGLIGFGFQANSAVQAVPFVQQLATEGAITTPVFGLRLTLTNAELYIGGTDTSRMVGSLQAANVVATDGQGIHEWYIPMTSVQVGSKNILSAPSVPALMDSGTTSLVGPAADVANFYAAIPGSMTQAAYYQMLGKPLPTSITTGYVVPCGADTSGSFAGRGTAVSFNLAGTNWRLPYSSLTTANPDYTQKVNGYDYCDGSLAVLANNDKWIIGDYFLSNMYMEFDYGSNSSPAQVRLAYGQ